MKQSYHLEKVSSLIYELFIDAGNAKQRLINKQVQIRYVLTFDFNNEQANTKKKEILMKLANQNIFDKDSIHPSTDFKILLTGKRMTTCSLILKDIFTLFKLI